MEDKDIRKKAEWKLKEKNLDMIISNTPSAIGAAKTTVQIKRATHGWVILKNKNKSQIARKIINIAESIKV